MKKILAGCYLRLSKEDIKENNSIDAQREIIKKYAIDNNIEVIKEYVDNGYSGMLNSRPALNEMLVDIIKKRINMVIVKDISRLTRDKNKTGWYTEIFFPDNDIRFVSVTELIDSGERYNIDDSIMLRGIANQYYVKDISKKIKANKLAMKKKGEYVESKVPYGYIKDSKNKILIDEKVEKYIRNIFELYIEGNSSGKIAKFMNDKKIKTPSQYMNMKKKSKLWSSETVNSILNNPFYTGKFIINKYESDYITKKCKKNCNKKQWNIQENHHPKIIDIKTFENVEAIKESKKVKNKNKYKFLLRDMIVCGECERKMQYKNYSMPYFVCSMIYKTERKCNNKKELKEDTINKIIKEEIKERLKKFKIVEKIKTEESKKIEKTQEKLEQKKYNLYNQKCKKIISENEFIERYTYIKEEIKKNRNLKLNQLDYDKLNLIIENKLNNDQIKKIIEKISYYKNNRIQIKFRI